VAINQVVIKDDGTEVISGNGGKGGAQKNSGKAKQREAKFVIGK
jgi:hypothetical protein